MRRVNRVWVAATRLARRCRSPKPTAAQRVEFIFTWPRDAHARGLPQAGILVSSFSPSWNAQDRPAQAGDHAAAGQGARKVRVSPWLTSSSRRHPCREVWVQLESPKDRSTIGFSPLPPMVWMALHAGGGYPGGYCEQTFPLREQRRPFVFRACREVSRGRFYVCPSTTTPGSGVEGPVSGSITATPTDNDASPPQPR